MSVFTTLPLLLNLSAAVPSVVQDFGSVAVNGAGTPATITLTTVGLSSNPGISIGGADYSTGAVSCNSNFTNCSLSVTFAPHSPGLKQDALALKNTVGSIVALAYLHGIGTAPLLQILPATITTLAGDGNWNYTDGVASSSSFRNPQGLAIDLAGNIYVADSINQVVRKIAAGTSSVSTVAGNGMPGYSGDSGPALNATLNTPTGVAIDAGGNLFIADQGNGLIRRVDALSGTITTIAGGGSLTTSGIAATSVALSGPNDVAVDNAGNLYIADSFHNVIRKVTLATSVADTIAGGGTAAGSDGIGDGGAATAASLNDPNGVALDSAGNLFIADTGNSMIRRVDATTGVITDVAGSGSYGSAGDGLPATSATLSSPTGIRLDSTGNLYIADMGAQVIRFVNGFSGVISTIAGNGTFAYTGDQGNSTFASLSNPMDIALDTSGNILIADYSNNVIRKLSFVPPTLTFPSTNVTLTSAVVPVTLNNFGNATLTLSSLSIPAGFAQKLSGGSDCSATSSINAGANCQLNLVFTPTASGAISGNLALASNSKNVPSTTATITLAGTGLSGTPIATLSATSLTFSAQTVGTTSASQTITLSNTGTATLPVSTIQIAGANTSDFNIASTSCQSTLSVGSSCTIGVIVRPLLAGARTAVLAVVDAAANSPQTVTLTATGTGGAMPVMSSTSLQFASELISVAAPMQTLTLSNTGAAALSLFSVATSGLNTSDFAIASSTCGSTLAASASCTVTMSFVPTASGTRTANLLFVLSAGASLQAVALSGTGLLPPCVTSLSPSSQVYLAAGASDTVVVVAPSACTWAASASVGWISINSSSGTGSATLPFAVAANTTAQPRTGTVIVANQSETITQMGIGLRFVPMTPCRVLDTRNANGPFGGPIIAGATSRNFIIPNSVCGIPATAQVYALNFTVVPTRGLGFLSAWPAGNAQPLTSILNSDGRIKANAALVSAGTDAAITIYVSDPTHVILDISGYFVPATTTAALSFYPLTPCRIADTRTATVSFGQPYIPALTARSFPVQSSACNIPATAQAYSLNFTVVPKQSYVGYITAWPTGQSQPLVSTLNDFTGTIVANAAIVQGGNNGEISVYSTNDTDLIIDVDGYFAPQQTGGLSLYVVTPCRILDTRNGSNTPLNGTMTVSVLGLSQCPLPTQAQTFVLSATVVPHPALGYLALWPSATAQVLVSTLNAFDGVVTSNLAIVPGSSGSISAFTSNPSHLILDVSAYFGP